MALGEYKKELIKNKEKHMIPLTIEPCKIIPMIGYAWSQSFGRSTKNKKAIAERGWNSLNRVLLTDESFQATMTAHENDEESLPYYIPPQSSTAIVPYSTNSSIAIPILPPTISNSSTAIAPFSPTINPSPPPKSIERLNVDTGPASSVLDSLVQYSDLMEVRERNKVKRVEGKSLREQLVKGKKVTAGRCYKAGTCRLGQTVFDIVRDNKAK